MAQSVSSPTMSAVLINARVRAFERRFRETFRLYMQAANQDGFTPLTEPVKTRQEELIVLTQQEPMLQQQAQAQDQPAAVRAWAQKMLSRLQELRMMNGEPPAPA